MNRNAKFDEIKGMIRRIEIVAECAVLILIYYYIWKTSYGREVMHAYLGRGKYVLMAVYGVILLVLFILCEAFQFGHQKLIDVVVAQWISVTIANIITYFQLSLIANKMINAAPVLALTGIDYVLTLALCWAFAMIYHSRYVPRNMVMIYGEQNSLSLKFKMETRPDKYSVTKTLSEDAGYEEIIRVINRHDAVIINDVHGQLRNDILKYCYENGIRTYIAPKISDIVLRGAPSVSLFDTPLLLVKGLGLTPGERAIKRFFDVLLCLIAMVVAGPLMLLIALAIKLDDHGPVFYKQERVTRNGRLFDILKFRSMIVDAEKNGEAIAAVDNDPRITRVGRVIRASRMDELPQILNILKGDMSIVGPRPERKEFNDAYTEKIPEFPYRLKVKGGLTGYAQIYGKYNTSAYDKLRLDLMYIEDYSLLLDIRLILMTIRILFSKESTEGFDHTTTDEKEGDF